MTSLFSILLKNIILFILIAISLVFVFTKNIGFNEVRYIFSGMAVLYIVAACIEALSLAKIKKGTVKFVYFTDGFLAKRVLKIILFTCSGAVLYFSGSIIKYMAFLCFLIAVTEVIVTLWRYLKQLCFVTMENDVFIVSTNKLNTFRASQIAKIETRHGLVYVVGNNTKSITLRMDMMKEKETFKLAFDQWIKVNQLTDKVIVNE